MISMSPRTISDSEEIFLIGKSEAGAAHKERLQPDQDSVKVRQYRHGCILAVADGVGSERYAEFGSRAAVRAVHEVFCAYVRGDLRRELLTATIRTRYLELLKDYQRTSAATTCIFAAHIFAQGLFLGQIGDGVCCGKINGKEFLLGQKTDEFSNLVHPLSVKHPETEWTTRFVPREKLHSLEIMLATDGVSEDILPGKAPAFAEYLIDTVKSTGKKNRERHLSELLTNWETPNSVDDKTLALYQYKVQPKGE